MKKIIILNIFIFINLSIAAQPNWQWAKQIGGPGYNGGQAITDSSGNVYYCGGFTAQTYFATDTLMSNGSWDILLVKYDNNGNELWSKSFGSSDIDGATCYLDANETHLYLIGTYLNKITIDTCSLPFYIGGVDIFCAKLDLDGNCIWLKRFGSWANDQAFAACININDELFLTGYLGAITSLDTINNVAKGGFFARIDSNGNCVWAKNSFQDISITRVIPYSNDYVFCGVSLNDTCIVDTTTLFTNDIEDAIIARINNVGQAVWAKRNGGNLFDASIGLGLDYSGYIYNSGVFESNATFNGITLSNGNKDDCFLAKYDSIGNMIWINQSSANGIYGASGYGINTDSLGNTYFIGSFSGNATFGSFNLTAQGAQDMFIARYDSGGNCIGVFNVGGINSNTIGNTVSVDINGQVICTGTFTNSFNIGPQSFTEYGWGDGFVAKLDAITGKMENKSPNNQLLIYANPTQGKCNITIPDEFANEKQLTLTVYDNIGREIQVQTITMHVGKIKLNLTAQAKGMYHVSLSNGSKVYNGKIVFE